MNAFWPFLRKILPTVTAVGAAAVLALEWKAPVLSLTLYPLWVLSAALAFAIVSGHEARRATFWFLFLPPPILLFATLTFSLISEDTVVRLVLTILVPLVMWLFLYIHGLFVRQPARYQPYALEHLSLVVNLLTVFLLGASFVGYVIFLSLPSWTAALGLFGICGLLLAETLWASKVRGEQLPGLVLLGSVFFGEAAGALLLLPLSFLVSGALLAMTYYVVAGLLRAHALERCDRSVLVRYAATAGLSTVLILLTARWV